MKKGSHGKRKTRADAIAFLHQCWNCQHHHDHIEKLGHRKYKTGQILCDIKNALFPSNTDASQCASFKPYPRAI